MQESVPDGLVLKRTVLASLEGALAPHAIVASSTSTLGATALGEGRSFANRLTAALLREALDLVVQGVIGMRDLDHLVARGIATGWATRGPLATEIAGSGVGTLDAFVVKSEGPLSALLASLADWRTLAPWRRDSLRRASRGAGDALGECEWAAAIARVVRAAESGAS